MQNRENIESVYPMSDIQKGMAALSLLNPDGALYHDQFVYQVPKVDTVLFEESLLLMVRKHETLRTALDIHSYSEEVQIVYREIELPSVVIDLYNHNTTEQEAYIQSYMTAERSNPFKLTEAPLWRAVIFNLDKDRSVFLFQFHHAILDGWSVAAFNTELFQIYNQLKENRTFIPQQLRCNNRQHVLQELLAKKDATYAEFWKKELDEYKRLDIFAKDQDVTEERFSKSLSGPLVEQLKQACRKDRISIKAVLFSAYAYALNMLSYENDITFGLVSNNRPLVEDGDKILGCFLNTLPARVNFKEYKDFTWTSFFREMEQKLLNINSRSGLPLLEIAKIVDGQVGRENPFFDIIFNYVDFHVYNEITSGESHNNSSAPSKLKITSYERTNTYLDLTISAGNSKLSFNYRVEKRMVSGISLEQLHGYLENVLTQYLENKDAAIGNDNILLLEEREELVSRLNDTAKQFDSFGIETHSGTLVLASNTVMDLLEAQWQQTPDHTAIISGGQIITYRQFHEQANQLAAYLCEKYAVVPGDLIGIGLERSEWLPIVILGILKAGAAYIPIDTKYPQERIDFILRDGNCKVFIDATALEQFRSVQDNYSKAFTPAGITSDNTAYCIYTSGSTGNPKGVLNSHGGLYNRLLWMNAYLNVTDRDVFLQKTPYTFDVSVWELLLPFITGGVLVMAAPEKHKDPAYLEDVISAHNVTIAHFVPSMLDVFLLDITVEKCATLHHIVCSGEELPAAVVMNCRNKLNGTRIHNLYGPTEAAIDVTAIDLTDVDVIQHGVSIGYPVANTRIYIVNELLQLQPMGVPGELLISGVQVAQGYLHLEELTAARFISDPFTPGNRVYRTGDIARWLPDGSLQYLGRKDNQVKVRGNRIELGEVEKAMLSFTGIKQGIAAVKEVNNEKMLVGYYTSSATVEEIALKQYLQGKLPEYMVPGYYVGLEAFPLSNNGKIDRKKLPDPDIAAKRKGSSIPPQTDMQKAIAEIWKKVLRVENVSIDDNFYDSGGDSLKAIRLISQYHRVFDVKLSAETLFANTTLESHAALISSSDTNKHSVIPVIPRDSAYPASDAQRKLWVISQVEEGSIAYNMPGSVRLKGDYNIHNLKRAILSVLERHEALRTVFRKDTEGTIHQVVLELSELGFYIGYENFAADKNPEQCAREYIRKDAYMPFDLEKGPLLRVCLLQLTDKDYILCYNMHHIISDGWSMNILARDILSYYKHYTEGTLLGLPPLRIQYKDYAAWQLAQLETGAYKAHRKYWLDKLSGELPVLDLPTYKPRPVVKTYNGRKMSTYLGEESTAAVRSYVTEKGGTLFMFLVASLKMLFHRYTGQEDIVAGSPIAGREHSDLEDQIGFYINTLALRSSITGNMSFDSFYEQVKQNLLASYEHQMYPLDRLMDELDVHRDGGRNALFDVRIVLQNTADAKEVRIGSIENKETIQDHGATKAKFDMLFIFEEIGGDITLELTYDSDVYDYEMMARLMKHYQQLVRKVVTDSHQKVGELVYFSDADKSAISYNLKEEYPEGETILDLFEEQVRKTPENIALVSGDIKWTYAELDTYSNKLSSYLREQYGIEPDDLIGIKLPASHWSVVSILGILKSGAGYVPVDADTPVERVQYLMEDTQVKTLIILSAEEEAAKDYHVDRLVLDKAWESLQATATHPAINQPGAKDLAYVIYTSGSTGQPKGVMVTHGNLADYVHGLFAHTTIGSCERFALMSSIATDLGNTVLYGSLLCGGALHIIPKEKLLVADDIHDYFRTHAIDCIKIVPSHWIALSRGEELLLPGRMIVFGGDILPVSYVEAICAQQPGIAIVNHYGPTETTIGKLLINIDSRVSHTKIPIGKPFSSTSVYVVDKQLNLCPAGIPGELLIGGKGVARGYLNKPELTGQQFIQGRFGPTGERLYRTGDLVRMLPDGNIEFLGRIDNQVKIRGFRVELGDVESALSSVEGVDTTLVLARISTGGDKELVAYYTGSKEIKEQELRAYLQGRLPSYMVPAYFIAIKEFPLTSNGKINRKALPAPEQLEQLNENSYIAPRNQQEQALADVWASVLKRKEIGVNANFFDLGGDSIKGILIVSRLKQKGYALKIADLLQTPVLSVLAGKLSLINREITQSLVSGDVLLTPIQKAFLSSGLYGDPSHYNQSVVLESLSPIDAVLLDKSLEHLVRHHDALRMVYRNEDGTWRQENKGAGYKGYSLVFHDLSGKSEYQPEMKVLCDDLQASIDLEHGPLFKTALFRLKDKDCVLLIIHHLVVDGVSWRILLEDLENIYRSLEKKSTIQLPKKSDSFQRWAKLLNEYALSDTLNQERPYWEKVLASKVRPLYSAEYSKDLHKGSVKRASFSLDKDIVELLQTKVHRVYNTEINDVLLTALGISILQVFGNDCVVLDMEGHGRETIIEGVDITRTVGWFTSMYPFLLSVDRKSSDFSISLIQVKETLRKVPNKGIGYGVLRYLGTGFDKEVASGIIFNYLGDFGRGATRTDDKESILFNYSNEYKGIESSKENDSLGKKLRVSGIIVNDGLQITVAYNDAIYEEKQVVALMDSYKDVLVKIIKQLSVTVQRYLTPGDLTYKDLSVADLLDLNGNNTIEDIYKLSPLQEGLFYHWISGKHKATYSAQRSFRLHMPDITLSNIRKSYELLVARHSILRTGFNTINGELLQVVRKEVADTFTYENVAAAMMDPETLELYVTDYKTSDRERGFDVGQDSLMRLSVLYLGDGMYELIWCNHHILMDGWCSSILVNEFYQILISLVTERPLSLPEVTPYSTYIKWLEKINKESGIAYWRNYLSDYTEKAGLPFNTTGEHTSGYLARQESVRITSQSMEKLRKICARYNVTENTFIQSAWGYLLSRYNNTRDVVYGAVVSGRPGEIDGVENMVGLFINTIPLRVNYSSDMKVSDLLEKQQGSFIAGLAHHYLNLSKVQSESLLGSDLFDHVFVFENYALNELGADIKNGTEANADKEKLSIVSGQSFTETHYDFDILVAPLKDGLQIELRYNGNIYKEEDILRVRHHLENVLSGFIEDPQMLLKDISYITASESRQLLDFNNTEISYPKNETILDLFKVQVRETPDNTAVSFDGTALTYKQLDVLSDQLADCLAKNYAVEKNDLVGIQLDRSREMLVAIWGILKTGAAYVPLDMQYPEERIQYIKEDSKYKVCINKAFISAFYAEKDTYQKGELPVQITGLDPAYGIYTSGSTGHPKGVLNTHAGLYNRLLWMRDDLQITHKDIILQKTPYTFDVSVWELLMPAVTGCQVVFAKPEGHKDPVYLQQVIQASAVSIIHFVPSMLSVFLEHLNPDSCRTIRHIVCSGEALSGTITEELKSKLPWVRIHNLYGPTEAAIDVTAIDLTDVDTKVAGVSIGKPVANTRIYIVDKDLVQQPVGVPGELLIEGVQVAQGYLNRPDLNQEKFIPSPFTKGERVYRTGDLAKWLPNGEIAYIGRIDNQVKIRGNRIELGEVESAISASGYVNNVVVVIKETGNNHKYLVGYLIPNENFTEDALYTFLNAHLPEYMVPGRMIVLEEFPLTTSGKINRKALSDLDDEPVISGQYVAPENEMEAGLAVIWEDVLGYKGVSVRDDFFRTGGDSILAIRLISKINRKYDTNLTITQLYEFNTIAALSLFVAQKITSLEEEQNTRTEIERNIEELKESVLAETDNPDDIEDIYPMSDIQKGMVILSDLNQEKGVYHNQFVFQIPLVDKQLFKEAFARLVWKHAILRTQLDLSTYRASIQIVRKEIDFSIDYKDISDLTTKEKKAYIHEYMLAERKRPFKIDSGLLWRISLFTINDSSSIFLFQFHHAILDGWSLASLNTELFNIYRQLKEDLPLPLEKLKATNRDAIIAELYDKRNPEAIDFWKTSLADFRKPDIFTNEDENQRLIKAYDFNFKHQLENKCKNDEVSPKTVIYGAFIYALKLINYESDFVVGVLANNRPVIEDGDKLLGCFLNNIPVRNKFESLPLLSLSDYFKEIEKNLKSIQKNDRLTLYEISKIMNEKAAGGSPFFDVMFNYVNFHIYHTLALNTDKDYRKSLEEEISEDYVVLNNTTLDLTANALGNSLALTYKLKKGLKNDVTLEKIHHYVETILTNYVGNSETIISDIDYLTNKEKQLFQHTINTLDSEYLPEQTILNLFNEQVKATPGNIALVSGDVRWTYKELDTYSNQLACYLQEHYAIGADDLIGIKLPASHWSVVSILGILKSGAAYVPIDAETPLERVQYLTTDTRIKTLIILSAEEEKAKDYHVDTLVVDKTWDVLQAVELQPVTNVPAPRDLAYVIYTSGSTGQPKGVMVTHGNLTDYVHGLFAHTEIGSCKQFALMSSIATDLGNTVLYGSLLCGGALHILPKEKLLIADDVQDYFKTHAIDCIKIVPSHWIALSRGEELLLPGRMIVFGGDTLPVSYVEAIRAQRPEIAIVNHYGPTETTIGKLLINIDSRVSHTKIPIGKPFSSTSVYVVDKQLNLCPAGIPGELLIGGKGVAKGYLNKPALTAQHFIRARFGTTEETLYRTGDLVRMLADGNIEFLGRIDNQVKIRGHRVELGDVEAAIRSSGLVENVAVLIKSTETGRKLLLGYVITKEGYTSDVLYTYLANHLPDYMIPGRILTLEEFPLMANGKIDRKRLVDLKFEREILEQFVAPGNEVEATLVAIWEKVLEHKGIGIYDNFFRIGGDSLLVVKLKHELGKAFKESINIVDLFNNTTIAEQAKLFMGSAELAEVSVINEIKF